MTTVMQLWGSPQGPTPYDGQYLRDFDFEAADGRGEILMTPKIEEAKRFADLAEAIAYRQRCPVCRPIREDGQPNRPLTATNWSFVDPDKVPA